MRVKRTPLRRLAGRLCAADLPLKRAGGIDAHKWAHGFEEPCMSARGSPSSRGLRELRISRGLYFLPPRPSPICPPVVEGATIEPVRGVHRLFWGKNLFLF